MPILQVLNPDYLHPGTLRDWAGRGILALLVFKQHVLAICMVGDAMAHGCHSVGHAMQCQSSTQHAPGLYCKVLSQILVLCRWVSVSWLGPLVSDYV